MAKKVVVVAKVPTERLDSVVDFISALYRGRNADEIRSVLERTSIKIARGIDEAKADLIVQKLTSLGADARAEDFVETIVTKKPTVEDKAFDPYVSPFRREQANAAKERARKIVDEIVGRDDAKQADALDDLTTDHDDDLIRDLLDSLLTDKQDAPTPTAIGRAHIDIRKETVEETERLRRDPDAGLALEHTIPGKAVRKQQPPAGDNLEHTVLPGAPPPSRTPRPPRQLADADPRTEITSAIRLQVLKELKSHELGFWVLSLRIVAFIVSPVVIAAAVSIMLGFAPRSVVPTDPEARAVFAAVIFVAGALFASLLFGVTVVMDKMKTYIFELYDIKKILNDILYR